MQGYIFPCVCVGGGGGGGGGRGVLETLYLPTPGLKLIKTFLCNEVLGERCCSVWRKSPPNDVTVYIDK